MLSHVLQPKPRGSVRRELCRQGLGVGGLIFWFALWTRSDTGLLKTTSPTEASAGRYQPKLYGVFRNYTGFAGQSGVFFFTDRVMNYSGSLVHVGFTIRGSKNIFSSHIFTPFPPTGTWCPIGAGAGSKSFQLANRPRTGLFFPARARLRAIWWHHGIRLFTVYLHVSSLSSAKTVAVAARFVRLRGKFNANYLWLIFHKLNVSVSQTA